MDEITKDSRFSHIVKDPRFKKLPKKHVKVKIDKRFQSMFNDKKFQIKYKVDKRGRAVNIGDSEDLKRYYELSDSVSEEDNDDEEESEDEEKVNISENSLTKKERDVIKISKKEKETITPEIKKKLNDLTIDYARGEGAILSDSSSEEDSNEESDEYEFDHDWGELDKDAEYTSECTNRLAVCNMNWDRIEAKDLMVLFNSFLPSGGLIKSITIYPSEFGLQRMKEEEEKGPVELIEEMPEGEDEELNQIQMEKLRKYQLNRLKYYYAVIVCDSVETADVLYKECDGMEYESSSNKLDLRFIPDDITFDQKPREFCDSLPDLSQYKPRLFMTSALTKAKVDLTWDETDPNREEIVKSVHNGDVDENNLKKYLACSSSSEESESELEDDDNKSRISTKSGMGEIEKYKALLADIENKEKTNKKNEVNLEVSWNLELENKTSKIVKEAAKEKEPKTPFEQYLDKRKEKKKKKREERIAKLEEKNQGSEDSAFSDDDIPSDIDLNDPYFKEELEGTKPKKLSKKKKRREEEEDEGSKQKKAELELLMLDNEPESKHFSLKKIEENEKTSKKKKLKGKKRKTETEEFKDDFKVDVNDERFSALYTSHHFNIDPADPQFRSTKATKELIEEKLRRREKEDPAFSKTKLEEEPPSKKSKNAELLVLVKNIKKNTSEVRKKVQ